MSNILNQIGEQLLAGVMFHTEMADLFNFLGLKKLYQWQECQMYTELKCLQELKCHTLKYHNQLLNTNDAEQPQTLIKEEWYDKYITDITAQDIKVIVKECFEVYIAREESVLDKFIEMQSSLTKENDKSFLANLIQSTECELAQIILMKQKLDIMNYDIPSICILLDFET